MNPRVLCAASLAAFCIAVNVSAVAASNLPRSASQVQISFSKTVKKAAPAVVTVYAKRVVKKRAVPKFFEPFLRGNPNFNRARVERALGSGVIVHKDGFIVTNYHVIKNARELTVTMRDRREFEARVVSTDEASDLAVLRIDPKGEKLPFLSFLDSDTIEVGDLVLAIGNPFGVGQTITNGIVSATARSQAGINDVGFFLQTDAATNQGNSGGALVTLDGKLAGINTAIYSKTGGFMGIGFSIPANMVYLVVRAAISGNSVRRPWSGAVVQEVTSAIARAAGLEKSGGVLVAQVYPKSPAAKAGLKKGDIILKVGDKETLTVAAFRYHLALAGEKKEIEVAYSRDGKWKETDLPIEVPPMDPPPNYFVLTGKNPLSGARVANLSPALALEMRLAPKARGVVIYELTAGAPAARLLKKGDIVLNVNGKQIDKVQTLRGLLAQNKRPWAVTLRRGRQNLTLNQK